MLINSHRRIDELNMIFFSFWNCQGHMTEYPILYKILSESSESSLLLKLRKTFASSKNNYSLRDFQFPVYISERKERQLMERVITIKYSCRLSI